MRANLTGTQRAVGLSGDSREARKSQERQLLKQEKCLFPASLSNACLLARGGFVFFFSPANSLLTVALNSQSIFLRTNEKNKQTLILDSAWAAELLRHCTVPWEFARGREQLATSPTCLMAFSYTNQLDIHTLRHTAGYTSSTECLRVQDRRRPSTQSLSLEGRRKSGVLPCSESSDRIFRASGARVVPGTMLRESRPMNTFSKATIG